MGNIEKLVVVTVLFLVAIVLGVTLNRPGDTDGRGPIDGLVADAGEDGNETDDGSSEPVRPAGPTPGLDDAPVDSEPSVPGPRELDPGANGPGSGLLSAPVRDGDDGDDGVDGSVETPPADPGRILVTEAGLERSGLPEYRIYTCAGSDTWASLSQRFYDSRSYTGALRSANEGVTIGPRVRILVPVYDVTLGEGRDAVEPMVRDDVAVEDEVVEAAPSGGGVTHVVASGETLSAISKKYYGTSNRYMDIFEANRDVLADPNAVMPDMRLVIP